MLRALEPFPTSRVFGTQLWSVLAAAQGQIMPSASRNLSRHQIKSIELACAHVCQAALDNHFVMSSLGDFQRDELVKWYSRYCSFREEFFATEKEKEEYYQEHWRFQPTNTPTAALPFSLYEVSMSSAVSYTLLRSDSAFRLQSVTREVESLLPRLLPSDTFFQDREEVRQRLEHILTQIPLIPKGALPHEPGRCGHIQEASRESVYAFSVCLSLTCDCRVTQGRLSVFLVLQPTTSDPKVCFHGNISIPYEAQVMK